MKIYYNRLKGGENMVYWNENKNIYDDDYFIMDMLTDDENYYIDDDESYDMFEDGSYKEFED